MDPENQLIDDYITPLLSAYFAKHEGYSYDSFLVWIASQLKLRFPESSDPKTMFSLPDYADKAHVCPHCSKQFLDSEE
jgi:hypothetical protein